MKRLFFVVALLLALMPVSAQGIPCADAVSQALPLLEGARALIEAGNADSALSLIQSAEDLLTGCTADAPPVVEVTAVPPVAEATVQPTVEVNVAEATPVPPVVEATVQPTVEVSVVEATPVVEATAEAAAPVGGYVLNPPPIDVNQGITFVTFVHTSVDSGPVDIYYGDQPTPVVAGLTYGTFTGFVPMQSGNRTFRARPAGSGPTGEVLYRMSWDYQANSTWMVTAAGVASRVAFIVEPITIIRNNYDGQARVRVINLIATGPRVTVTASNGTVLGNGLGWVGIKDTMVAPGEYTLNATTQSGLALAQPITTTFAANHTYTLFMIGDGSAERPLSILNLPVREDITRVRFVNHRADTVDVHARPGNAKIVTEIASNVTTDWIELPSGSFTFLAFAPGTGPTGRQLAGIATQLRPQRDVTIIIGDGAMAEQTTELRPQ